MTKRIISLILCVLMLTGASAALSGCSNDAQKSTDYKLSDKIDTGAILHCFCWDFETIINSLDDIAAAGYSAIQTSPVNECLVGESGGMQLYGNGKWYYHFQPTDYTIGNYQLGTRDQFKKMCSKADKLGIKVIVDVVPNHTTPATGSINDKLLDAVGGINNLYHKNSAGDISDYGNRLQCTTYKMGGLPDINTENKAFQDYFIAYLNDCIACGADGFRYDAAKHIGLPDDPTEKNGVKNNFWTRVTKEVKNSKNIFHYGEVLQGNNDRIRDYIDTIGHTTASGYGGAIRNAVMKGFIDTAFVEDFRGGNEKCVTWVESHDNYINDGNWLAMSEEQVIAAWAIICGRSSGTPLFFDRPYGSSQDDQWGMNRIGASGSYMYKNDAVKAVNFFRTAMIGEEEVLTNPDDDSYVLEISRGNKGAVLVSTGEDEIKVDFETALDDGTYIDRVDNETVYTVKDGKITCDKGIQQYQVVVLYNEGYTEYETPALVKVDDQTSFTFEEDTLDVKLLVENAEEGTYSINGGKEKKYENDKLITLKADEGKNGVTTLELRAENSAGKKTYMKYFFSNTVNKGEDTSVEKGDKIYFKKPDNWGDKIYAYVYDDSPSQNSQWPGIEMKKTDGGKYEYTFKFDWEEGYVIFSDGENQYPGQNEQGLPLKKSKAYEIC